MIKRLLRRNNTALWTKRAQLAVGSGGDGLTANAPTRLSASTHLGHDVHMNGFRVKGAGRVDIGSHFHCGTGCSILTDIHDYAGTSLPYGHETISRPVTIGDNVWLGQEVMILGGVTIGEGAIVQARSVVVADVAPLDIVGGHPARPFSARDADHYWALRRKQACCAAPVADSGPA